MEGPRRLNTDDLRVGWNHDAMRRLMREAADEIDRLREQVESLESDRNYWERRAMINE